MGKKDAYWFRHDANSGRGLRILKIQAMYGHWGKGVYWDVVEVLRSSEKYRFPDTDLDLKILGQMIGIDDENMFQKWMDDCVEVGLIKRENGFIFSEGLNETMAFWDKQKTNGNQGGRPKKNPNKTQTITQTEPNPKPNPEPYDNHNRQTDIKKENKKEKNLSEGDGEKLDAETFARNIGTEWMGERIWLESVCIQVRKKPDEVAELIREFVLLQISSGLHRRGSVDMKRHFANWVKTRAIKTDLDSKQNGGMSTPTAKTIKFPKNE